MDAKKEIEKLREQIKQSGEYIASEGRRQGSFTVYACAPSGAA